MADRAMSGPQNNRTAASDRVPIIRATTFVAIVVLYECAARSGLLYKGVVPSLVEIGRALFDLLTSPAFYPNVGATAFEAFGGLLIGALFGFALGLSFALFRFIGDALYPWLLWLAPTPKIILVPILFLLFGIDMSSKVAMAAISAFFPLFIAIFASARQVSPVFLRVMASYDATRMQIIRQVYLPVLVAPLIGALRLSLGLAIIGALLAEIKAAKVGLGMLLIESYNFFEIPDMYAILLLVFGFAFLANYILDRIGTRLAHPT